MRFLLALCQGNRADAEDLAQETALKAYLSYNGFVERFKFSTWLYRIAYNSYIDSCRKKRIQTDSLESAGHLAGTDQQGENMRREELLKAIDGLPANEKTAMLLFYMEEMKILDIAIVMHKPVGTVKSYLNRGRRHIKNKMKNE